MESQEKKQYTPPEIIYEADLEVKAGTPINPSDDTDIDLFPGVGG